MPVGMVAGLAVFVILVCGARYVVEANVLPDPLLVRVTGLGDEALEDVRVLYGPQRDGRIFRLARTEYFKPMEPLWVTEMALQLPAEALEKISGVRIQVGGEPREFTGAEIRSEWARENEAPPGSVRLIVPDAFERASVFPWIGRPPWNWPGDIAYVQAIVRYTLVPIVALLLTAFLAIRASSAKGRTWCMRVLGCTGEPIEHAAGGRFWNAIGLGFLAGAFAFLELREPYYFTQDDNLVDCLPSILWGCRCFWNGEFPHYDPFLFLGAPCAGVGIYAQTYPPTHLSYAVARHLLGNENATVEVFALAHLVVGFLLMRRLCQRLEMGALAANVTALAFVLSGAIVVVGRSWFNFLPVVVFLPALFLGLLRLCRGPVPWLWVLVMGMASGLAFHVGFSQAAIYVCAAFCLGVFYAVAMGMLPWQRALWAVPALLIGAGLALPLVYQQWLLSRGVERFDANSAGVGRGLAAMLLPYPLVESSLPTEWGNVHPEAMGHFYFFGGVLAFLFLLQCVGLAYFRPGRSAWAGQLWTVLGFVTLWLALGEAGGLWTIAARLPVVGFINRYPMRLMPFAVFFVCLSGGLVLDRIVRLSARRGRAEAIAGALALGLLAWHVGMCRIAFFVYSFRPYPQLPAAMEDLLRSKGQSTGRLASWAPDRSVDPHFAWVLPLNLPAVYELPALSGYNPLLEGNPAVASVKKNLVLDPTAALRAYGVRWHLDLDAAHVPVPAVLHGSWNLEVVPASEAVRSAFDPGRLPAVYDAEGVHVSELGGSHPLAFAQRQPGAGLPLAYHGWGVEIDVSGLSAGENVVANFLHYPDMTAELDGHVAACEPDEWNRVSVRLPEVGKTLSLRYRPRWGRGGWGGAVLVGLGVVGVFVLGRSRLAIAAAGVSPPPAPPS